MKVFPDKVGSWVAFEYLQAQFQKYVLHDISEMVVFLFTSNMYESRDIVAQLLEIAYW